MKKGKCDMTGFVPENKSSAVRSAMLAIVAMFIATGASADGVMSEISSSVKANWRRIASKSADILELREERKTLPESTFWFWETDKKDQDAKIRSALRSVREILLSTDSQKMMERIDDLDEDIAGVEEDIRDVTEERVLNLDKASECDEKLAKLRQKKEALQANRRNLAAQVCAELRALGLKVSGEAAEQCLFPVNFGDIVDGVVVARSVASVVDNLRELMATGDVASARRYFGMYLVMIDVQVLCFEDYLAKSRDGEWRQGLNRILSDATTARDEALANSRCDTFTAEQRRVFAHNSDVNGATIRAATAYLKILDSHEVVISDKLAAARKVRMVVESSYDTVNLAGDFLGLAKANQKAFDALLNLDLPPVEIFDDANVQQEFLAITRKLKE